MGFTTKLLLNTTRVKNDGTYPLILRITFYRKIVKITLGHCFKIQDWDDKKQSIKNTSKISTNITRLNHLIKKQEALYYDKVSELEIADKLEGLSAKELKAILLNTVIEDKVNLYDYIEKLIQEKLEAGKKGSALSYRGAKRKLQACFGETIQSFEQINFSALKKIETIHLHDGGDMGGLGVYMRTLRAIYNRAIKDGIVSADYYPFKDYKIKTADTQRRALSEENFDLFKNLKLNESLSKAQDLFMASYYLRGANYIDLAYLQTSNIEGDFERIRYQRNKTGKFFSIKIYPALRKILLKYQKYNTDKNAYLFPILDMSLSKEQHYDIIKNKRKRLNKKLRLISETHNIEPFTIYAARHTYATMGKRKGVPTAIIQESLGHKTEAITQKYLSSFDNSVVDDYDELIMQ